MTARETAGSNVEPGLIQRVAQGLRYVITGAGPEAWFGPQQPLPPIAQDKTEGRGFDYPVGVNLRIQPRNTEVNPFYVMRNLADGYDLLRLVIETRKDQIKSFEWEVVPEDEGADASVLKEQIKQAADFFGRPDKEHAWDDWLSMFVEELLVIDAVAVYPALTRGGKVYALQLVDAATITRKIDATGRTPVPPDPAYQQVLHGVAANDLTSDQLVYMMRNPRVSRLYGFSPVEQIIMTVNIALRRQLSQLEFYTSGNVPEAIAQVPDTWTPKNVQEFQMMWDALNEGNTAQRRKMRFVPSLKDIVFPKKDVLKDEYDEWLARIVCFAFSIPPTAFIKQNNRATGEQAAETAKEEGLMPLLQWIQNKVNYLIAYHLQIPGVKFKWKMQEALDPLVQAQVDEILTAARIKTPAEARVERGMKPLTTQEAEEAWPPPPEKPPTAVEAAGGAQGKEGAAVTEEKFAKMLHEMTKGQKPPTVEFRPEINVEVGDTVVNVPRQPKAEVNVEVGDTVVQVPAQKSADAAIGQLAKAITEMPAPEVNLTLGDVTVQADMRGAPGRRSAQQVVRAERQPDGTLLAKIEEVPSEGSEQ